MAKNYDGQKVYAELGKLSPTEQAVELANIKQFVLNNLEGLASEKQDEVDAVQQTIQKINGNQ